MTNKYLSTKIEFESDLNKLMEDAGVHALEEKIAVCKVLAELNIAASVEFKHTSGAGTFSRSIEDSSIAYRSIEYHSTEIFDKLVACDFGSYARKLVTA